jgi:hypothetical protein
MVLYSTRTVFCHCSCLLRIRLNTSESEEGGRERKYTVSVQCSVQYTLFNVGSVFLCVIYQLNFTIFMYVTRILRLYIVFSIIHGFMQQRYDLEHITRRYGGPPVYSFTRLIFFFFGNLQML